ncbi:MAG: beta-propeller fold lactonase family protein [Pelagimonas sp.]|uniref:beta-propeller fold lactonase family protein n=1 Tax=Pelagimonas sp. TaxID=2073170 RepID=UPI003D6B9789
MPQSTLSLQHTESTTGTSLNGARGLETIHIGERTFLYIAGVYADSISVYEMFSDGTTDLVTTVANDSTNALNGVSGFASIEISGTNYLYAVSESDDSLSVFEVQQDGTLSLSQTIIDDATLELDLPFGELSIVQSGANQFLIVHGYYDDGLSVFQIGVDGTLTNTANIDDTLQPEFGMNAASDTAVVTMGANTFVYVTGRDDDAITVFELTSSGLLMYVATVNDVSTLLLNGALGIEAATIGANTFLYVAGLNDDGISVFQVAANGTLTNVFNYSDTTELALNGATDIEVFEFEGGSYLAATGAYDDGVSLFEIDATGALTEVETLFDSADPSLALNGTLAVEFVDVDGVGFLVASGLDDDGFSVFRLNGDAPAIDGTQSDNLLIGNPEGDEINGLGGDDLIIAQGGDDTVDAGQGDDIVNGGAGDDLILGDDDLVQTESNVTTITETGQDLALTVTLPDASDGSTLDISGLINRQPLDTGTFNIVYVIDVSPSMNDAFLGAETIGDLNQDGAANTLLDGTIAAYEALTASIVSAGFTSSNVTIVAFDGSAQTVYSGSVIGGVVSALEALDFGSSTNFEAALQETIAALSTAGPGQNRVFFMSDGENISGGNFLDEVATLIDPNGLNANVSAVGLGNDASLADLDLVDDGLANNSAVRVIEPSSLTANLTGSPVANSEVDRLEIHVNGTLRRTLNDNEFTVTPLGLQYNVSVEGLSTSAGDVIEVILVASDSAATQVAVSLTVPNMALDIGDDTLVGGIGDDTLHGNGGNDQLFGGDGMDALIGGSGNDLLDGGLGGDLLIGGSGNDTLIGGGDLDTLQGGLGDDVYYIDRIDIVDELSAGGSGYDHIFTHQSIDLSWSQFLGVFEAVTLEGENNVFATGTNLNDVLRGNVGDNVLRGMGGADSLSGGQGEDTIRGGTGGDSLYGGDGADTIYGEDGRDLIFGGNQGDFLVGGDSNDTLSGGDGRDTLLGGGGADSLLGGRGMDDLRGGDGHDTLFGGDSEDLLSGAQGNDDMRGGNGHDTLIGNTGLDTLAGGAGNDSLSGGDDEDTLVGNGGNDTLLGGNQNDNLSGGDNSDSLYGENGSDLLDGGNQSDYLDGGDNNDTLLGGEGNDTAVGGIGYDSIDGGAGNDSLRGNEGSDTLEGDAGLDTLFGGSGHDEMQGGDDDDVLYGNQGNDTLEGGDGDDLLSAGDNNDTAIGGDGYDTISGGSGADELRGGAQNDTLNGDAGNDLLYGGTGRDSLLGGDNNDSLFGNEGQDTLRGGDGADSLSGGNNNDVLYGNSGDDTLAGGDGSDSLLGGDDADVLFGNGGRDTLLGGTGADTLTGGLDADVLTGGLGADEFDFNSIAEIGTSGGVNDLITDFDQGTDVIDLSDIDALTTVGGDQSFQFVGTLAHSGAGATLRYVTTATQTHIYGDVDGDGAGDFRLTLDGVYVLTASDFIL